MSAAGGTRILVVSLNFHPEEISTGKYSTELAGYLAEHGFDVRVVAAPPYYPEWRVRHPYRWWRYASERLGRMEIKRSPLWVPRRVTGVTRVLHLSSFAISTAPLLLAQVSWKPRWVFLVAPTILVAPAALLLSWFSGARSWLHVQDFELDAAFGLNMLEGGAAYRTGRWVEGVLLRRFAKVSTISEPMRQRLLEAGIPPARTALVPNWVDTDEIRPTEDVAEMRAHLGAGPEDVVALYSGNMGRKQGLDLVLDAARRLDAAKGICFVLCGEGVERERLERASSELGNVRFFPLQPRDRLNALLSSADVHLLPQESGAADFVMPSKLTGMLASGRPIVTTAVEGTALASVVERCGIVVPPGDVAALATAIERLASDPAERRELGARGRAYAEAELSRTGILSRLASELRDGSTA